jgi:hypothetical protein
MLGVVAKLRRVRDQLAIARYRRSGINQQLRDERGRYELAMAREGIKTVRF